MNIKELKNLLKQAYDLGLEGLDSNEKIMESLINEVELK